MSATRRPPVFVLEPIDRTLTATPCACCPDAYNAVAVVWFASSLQGWFPACQWCSSRIAAQMLLETLLRRATKAAA